MEYLSGGSLSDLIKKTHESGAKLKDIDASRIIKGILEAVAYLHGFDIAHRDLKPGKHFLFHYPYFNRKHYVRKAKRLQLFEAHRLWTKR